MITAVEVDNPDPVKVTACPALADGNAAFAGVPLIATDGAPVNRRSVIVDSVAVNGALEPPAVATVIGPNTPALSGTVRLTESLATLLPNTSGPAVLLRSATEVVPKLYWLL